MRYLYLGIVWLWACQRVEPPTYELRLSDDVRIGWKKPFAVFPLENDSIYEEAKFWVLRPPLSGLKEFRNGVLIYFPENELDTLVTFQYYVQTNTQIQTARIRLLLTEHWPCERGAVADYDTTFKNSAFHKIDVSSNDRFCGKKGDGLSILAAPAFGEALVENGEMYYRPKPGFVGSDTFVYQTLRPRDYAPVFVRVFQDSGCVIVANPDYKSFAYKGRIEVDVLANDKITCKDEFDKNRFSILKQVEKGALILENGKLFFEIKSYSPDRYTGTYQICYFNGECSFAQVVLDVLPCPPVRAHSDITFMYPEWGYLEINYLENDDYCLYNLGADRVAIVEAPKQGEVQILEEKFIYYLKNQSFLGSDDFLYRICDNQSNCDTARVFVSVRRR